MARPAKHKRLMDALSDEEFINITSETEEVEKTIEILTEGDKTDGALQYTPNAGIVLLATTIRSTLLEIAATKERNQERRHQEIMALLREHLQTDSSAVGIVDRPTSPVVNTEVSLESNSKDIALEQLRKKLTTSAPAKLSCETLNLRQKMLEAQRLKMEDRERKKRLTNT